MTVLNLQVSAGADDGFWTSAGGFDSSSGFWNFAGNVSGGWRNTFIRFSGVSIPGGATISDAVMTLRSSIARSETIVNLLLRAVAADNATAPANFTQVNGATRTSASVAWNNVPAWSDNTDYNSPSITPIIQEIVNRGGWSSGNAIVLYIEDNGSSNDAWRSIRTYENFAAHAPKLYIDYATNTAPTITVNPSVNYNGYTRTGPNNSPITVTFEAEDAEETGTDGLTVEVRTAASGGGTLVATDDYTSGTAGSISIAHNASGLSEGSNTLYLRVGDGTDWSGDESFTLLVDRGAPTVGTIVVSPDVVTGGE